MRIRTLSLVLFPFLLIGTLAVGCAGGGKEKPEPVLIREEPEQPSGDTLVVEEAPAEVETTATGKVRLDLPKPGFRGVPGTFTWKGYPGAATYRFVLLDRTQTVLFRSEPIAENRIETPPEVSAVFEPDGLFLWEVLAFDAEGEKLAGSPFRDFIYTP